MKTNEIAIKAIKSLRKKLFNSSIYKESIDLSKEKLEAMSIEEIKDYAFFASCEIVGTVKELMELTDHLKWLEENDYFGMND